MAEKDDSEKLIGKLIRKRKAENDAFLKLLTAMESKAVAPVNTGSKRKHKPTHLTD
jgi:hypothetical protein